jgi:hypothetical protein
MLRLPSRFREGCPKGGVVVDEFKSTHYAIDCTGIICSANRFRRAVIPAFAKMTAFGAFKMTTVPIDSGG